MTTNTETYLDITTEVGGLGCSNPVFNIQVRGLLEKEAMFIQQYYGDELRKELDLMVQDYQNLAIGNIKPS